MEGQRHNNPLHRKYRTVSLRVTRVSTSLPLRSSTPPTPAERRAPVAVYHARWCAWATRKHKHFRLPAAMSFRFRAQRVHVA